MQKGRKVAKVVHSKSHVRIGKNGLTEGVVAEVRRWLEEEGVIKVKVLNSLLRYRDTDINTLAEELAKAVNARIADIRGNTFILIKMKGRATEQHHPIST